MSATMTIGGTIYKMIEDMFDLTNALNERQRLQCDVIDYSGVAHFQKGEQVVVIDPLLGVIFNGYLSTDKEVPQYPTGIIIHSIDCIGQHYLADKRTYTRNYITPTYAGKIAVDHLNDVLSQEGIYQNYAQHFDSTKANFNQGILSGTMGSNNIVDGDLELLTAGSDLSIVEDSFETFGNGTLTNMQASSNFLSPTTVNALKMQSVLSFAYGTEFAQSQQTASGTAGGTASGTVSGSVNSFGTTFPTGSVFIFGGNPGESASFSGGSDSVNVSGSYSSGFSAPVSSSFSGAPVTQTYQPKLKSKVKVDATHYSVVTVDVAVADNRVDAQIWTGSHTVASNDTLNYDIWISSTSPSQEGGVDLFFNDGTSLTEYLGSLDNNNDAGIWDQNLVSVSPIQDLSDYAKDTWYKRQVNIAPLVGKVIISVSIFNAANIAGTFDIYIKNCFLGSQSGSPFFGTAQTAPSVNPPVVSSLGAYVTAATLVTVSPVYVPATSSRISSAYNIDSVKLVKNSLITWVSLLPTVGPNVVPGSPGAATVPAVSNVFVSYDGTTWLPCKNQQPIPGLQSGANVASTSLYLLETFSGGQDPTAIPELLNVSINIYSAPNATTTDIVEEFGTTAEWNTGTIEGTSPNSNGDLALGTTTYSWSNLSNMTYIGGYLVDTDVVLPTQSVSGGAYLVTSQGDSDGNTWSSTRFNFISAAQNFTLQGDFTLSGTSPDQNEMGFLYRQTFWGSPNNSFAYYVRIMQNGSGSAGGTSVTFGYGTNNPPNTTNIYTSGPYTVLQTVAETIANGTTYHIKVVVSQNRHTIYWNNNSTPIIDMLDNTYTGPGNIGLRTYVNAMNTNVMVAKLANFSVTNTFAGIWTSPSINLSSLGTCGNTQIAWSEVTAGGNVQSTAIVTASLDGGSTWTQCTNSSISSTSFIPGLSNGTNVTGKSLLIQIILSSTGFLISPIISGLYFRICGQYPGSSGTRSTIPLGNDTFFRSNVGSGWGTSIDSQSWTKTGTGSVNLSSDEGIISNTTGDVHMVLGSRTSTDEDGTCRFSISIASQVVGIELRYNDANNFYRFSVSATVANILRNNAGTLSTLSTLGIALFTGTFYRMRFRVVGNGPVILLGRIWLDGTIEPTAWTIAATN